MIFCALTPAAVRLSVVKRSKSGKKRMRPVRTVPESVVFATPLAAALLALSTFPCRGLKLPYTHPNNTVRLLASAAGPTGQIVAAENLEMGFRYLRADHSLLGGLWLDVPQTRGQPGDSVYSAFMMQEGALFVERPMKEEGERVKALIMFAICTCLYRLIC